MSRPQVLIGWGRGGILGVEGLLMLMLAVAGRGDPRLDAGVRAYEATEFAQALSALRPLFRERPGYATAEHGAVAYWLGKSYEAVGHSDSARWAWRRGVNAMQEAGTFEARLFDAHLWAQVADSTASDGRVGSTYRALLGRVGACTRARSCAVLRRHVAQLRPLLPPALVRRLLVHGEDGSPDEWTFLPDAGTHLLRWWRRQDPLPATAQNERMIEHLQRVAQAQTEFGSTERLVGWDDRGDVFVRLGRPDRRLELSFQDLHFLQEVVRSGVSISPSDFPDNELWVYSSVDRTGRYLFAVNNGQFELGTATDLLPRALQGPFSAARRDQNVAYSAQAALRYIYDYLSMYYHDRGNVYSQIEGWFSFQNSLGSIAELREKTGREDGGMTIGDGPGQRRVYRGPGGNNGFPSAAAQATLRDVTHQERAFTRARAERMPRRRSGYASDSSALSVQVRTARFLETDGTPATEVYWAGRLPASNDTSVLSFLLNVAGVRYGPDYRRQSVVRTQYSVEPSGQARTLSPKLFRIGGATDPYHLAVQWDRFAGGGTDAGAPTTRRLGYETVRVDSLRPLQSDPSRLEMSDLRLMSVPEGDRGGGVSLLDRAVPYPFAQAQGQTALLLYFEIYHLGRNANDRVQYTIEYEVEREWEQGVFGRLFGGEERIRTGTATTYTGEHRRTEEYILLDWGEEVDREQEVIVTVQVTDETSGQTVERNVRLRLVPGSTS